MTQKIWKAELVTIWLYRLRHRLRPHLLQGTVPHLHWLRQFSFSSHPPLRQTHVQTHIHTLRHTYSGTCSNTHSLARMHTYITLQFWPLMIRFLQSCPWHTKSPNPPLVLDRSSSSGHLKPSSLSAVTAPTPKLELADTNLLIHWAWMLSVQRVCRLVPLVAVPLTKPVGWNTSLTIANPTLPHSTQKSMPIYSPM